MNESFNFYYSSTSSDRSFCKTLDHACSENGTGGNINWIGSSCVYFITDPQNIDYATTGSMYYIHKDHLGSFDKVTDEYGLVVDSYSFDAWGNRVGNEWNTADKIEHLFDRGYTGHEHLDKFGLINMNGRVYDPKLGRFLSPDPDIQEPDNSQNYNRYSYCLNNPLIFTDPSGENFIDDLSGVVNLVTAPFRFLTECTNATNALINGENYKWNSDYIYDPQSLSNAWRNNPNVVLGPNGYPMTTDGEYSPFASLLDERTILDASESSWKLQIAWLGSPKKLSDENSPWDYWIAGFDMVKVGANSDGKSSQKGNSIVSDIGTSSNYIELTVGIASRTLTDSKIGSNLAYKFAFNSKFLKGVSYLKPLGYWAMGFSFFSDIYLSVNDQQSWTETFVNTGVTGVSMAVSGWIGLVIQANYLASKTYLKAIIKHPEWAPYPIHGR